MRTLVVVLTMVFSSQGFSAGENKPQTHEIDQKGQKFSKESIEINRGDTLKFTNSDPTPHHLMVKVDGKPFNKAQPAKSPPVEIKFEQDQEVTVRCAIHPKMKLKVKVGDGDKAAKAESK